MKESKEKLTIKDKIELKKTMKVYDAIVAEFSRLADYYDEIRSLGSHRHFILDEIEENVLKLIELDEKVLGLHSRTKNNIGIIACCNYCPKVALRALDNEKAQTITSDFGDYNIGMWAVHYGLEEVALKALDNEQARRQRNNNWETIAMMAAKQGMEEVVLKALDDKVSSMYTDDFNKNLGMYAAENGLARATMKALENENLSVKQSLECGFNIGMYAVESGLEDCVIKALDNKMASLQSCNIIFANMGMLAARKGMVNATIKALKNPDARKQIDNRGCTIYDYAVEYNLNPVIDEYLEMMEEKDREIKNTSRLIDLVDEISDFSQKDDKSVETKDTEIEIIDTEIETIDTEDVSTMEN